MSGTELGTWHDFTLPPFNYHRQCETGRIIIPVSRLRKLRIEEIGYPLEVIPLEGGRGGI